MSTHELRPGDKINVVCSGVMQTPFGEKSQETTITLSYEDIVDRFSDHGSIVKSRAALFSRFAAQVNYAMTTGSWSNGAGIDKKVIFNNLKERFDHLKETERHSLTPKGLMALRQLSQHGELTSADRQVAKTMLEKCSVRRLIKT